MDARIVYVKTAKGVAEMAARSAGLAVATRRVLILVDGKRTVADLAPLLKPGEIDGVLAQLESQGFIRRDKPAEATRLPARIPAPSPTTPPEVNTLAGTLEERNLLTLDEAKRRAVRELVDRLGPEADALSLRIEQCRDGDELRGRLREAERLVAGFLGEAAVQDFLRALRRAR